jgi:hypothetical protein
MSCYSFVHLIDDPPPRQAEHPGPKGTNARIIHKPGNVLRDGDDGLLKNVFGLSLRKTHPPRYAADEARVCIIKPLPTRLIFEVSQPIQQTGASCDREIITPLVIHRGDHLYLLV